MNSGTTSVKQIKVLSGRSLSMLVSEWPWPPLQLPEQPFPGKGGRIIWSQTSSYHLSCEGIMSQDRLHPLCGRTRTYCLHWWEAFVLAQSQEFRSWAPLVPALIRTRFIRLIYTCRLSRFLYSCCFFLFMHVPSIHEDDNIINNIIILVDASYI